MPDLVCRMIESKVLLRLDICGFFLYWYSLLNEVRLIDLAHLEDVELLDPANWSYTDFFTERDSNSAECDQTTRLRPNLQCLRLQIPRLCASQFITDCPLDGHDFVNLIVSFEDKNATPEIWQETLINIAFRHRHVIENLATLDVFGRVKEAVSFKHFLQGIIVWIYLILHYGAIGVDSRSDQNPAGDSSHRVSGCCIAAAFGDEEITSQIPSIPLKDFTFDLFFDLFLQIWPREEIADMFATYSDGFGLMDHNGLNEFLNRSVSKSIRISHDRELCASTSRLDCPRKIKHINLMQWEARHFYRSQSKVNSTGPEQTGASCHSTAHRSRSEHRTGARSGRSGTASSHHGLIDRGRASRDQSVGTQAGHSAFQLSVDEFRRLVERYEWNRSSRDQNRFSVQGFYRFMLSHQYQLLMRYRTVRDPRSTVEQDDWSNRHLLEPITHYHIQSARLITVRNLNRECDANLTEQINLIRRRNMLTVTRAIRQLLLLGTRSQEQNLLASLLLDHLGDWLLTPPIPKFVAQANSPYVEKSKYYSQAHHHRSSFTRRLHKTEAVGATQNHIEPIGANKQHSGFEPVDEFEVILSLSSLTFARTVQLQHRARKQRLLKRLLHEAYGSRTQRRVKKRATDGDGKQTVGGTGLLNKNAALVGSSANGKLVGGTVGRGSIRLRGIRGWFGKRRVSPVNSTGETNISNRTSLLSNELSPAPRRPSLIAVPFLTRSPLAEKAHRVAAEANTNTGQTRNPFASLYRRFSVRSSDIPSPKTPSSKTSEVQEPVTDTSWKPTFEFRQSQSSIQTGVQLQRSLSMSSSSSSPSYSTSSQASSSAISRSQSTGSLHQNKSTKGAAKSTTTGSHDQPRSKSQLSTKIEGGLAQKPNKNFGRCSCSSGSKSRGSSSDSNVPNKANGGTGRQAQLKPIPGQHAQKPKQLQSNVNQQINSQEKNKSGSKKNQSASSGGPGGGSGGRRSGKADIVSNSTEAHLSNVRKVTNEKTVDEFTNRNVRQSSLKQTVSSRTKLSQTERKFDKTTIVSRSIGSNRSHEWTSTSTSDSTETTETSFTSTDSSLLNEDLHGGRLLSAESLRARRAARDQDETTESTESDFDSGPSPVRGYRPQVMNGPCRVQVAPIKANGTVMRSNTLEGFSGCTKMVTKYQTMRRTNVIGYSTWGSKYSEEEKNKPNIPRRTLWRQANQWLTKCRVVIVTLAQVLRILSNRTCAKALAEYPFVPFNMIGE
ncbi:unnamed protein product [Echinostoma caproni]|uniref:Protein kinase domain-containing protein n=1 Tax=Echinostoma caproni TaxID=27848 RepID=A0A183A6E9_9TREM|nr:unnamed protein product [Echinostoma caproni]